MRLPGAITMGKVAAVIKVMPQEPELDLSVLQERLEAALPEGAKINDVDQEEVAFGLTALYPTVIVPDDAGGTEAVEEAFRNVDGVESVTVEEVGRI
jgi:elongation factor 1-beta